MTRSDIITRATNIIGDSNLLVDARNWLDNILLEIESVGYWRFLENEVTYQTVSGTQNVTFTTLTITDYSKGITIRSGEPRKLIQLSKSALDEANDGALGNPKFFAIWNDSLYLYPTPTTGSVPILTIKYYQNITLPTADANDILTTVGIKQKWHKFLIDGVTHEGFNYLDDTRAEKYRMLFDRDLMLMLKDNEDYFTIRESKFDKPSSIRFGLQKTEINK